MYWGASAYGVLAGIIGGLLLICAVVFAKRLGRRRVTALLGGGLLLLGLSLSGVIEVLARALAILSFNPLRWLGLGAAALGALLLSVSGVLPGRRRRGKAASSEERKATSSEQRKGTSTDQSKAVESGGSSQPAADEDFGDIEEILRRRGIQ